MTAAGCRYAALLMLVSLGAAPAAAQVSPSPEQTRAFTAMAAPANLALGAPIGAALDESRSSVELILEGTEDEGVGTAAVGWKRGSAQYRAKFSSPINKSTKEATPFDIAEGLPAGATFELTIANLLWAQASDADIDALEKLCLAELRKPRCGIEELPAAARAEARTLLRFDDMPQYVGVTALISQRDFDYLDTALAKQSESQRNLSVTGRVGRFSPTFGFGFLSWTYQEQFKAGSDPQEICLPIDGTAGLACNEAVLGPPTKKTSSIVGAELRHWFGSSAAMSPSIKRDLKSDVTSVSLPVYFLKNKDGALTGGIRGNWRSDTSKLSFAVFVGTAFATTP